MGLHPHGGSHLGELPLNIELKLEVWDSPNSAGVVIERCAWPSWRSTTASPGALEGPSSYLMKSPPKQIVDDEAYEAAEEFIHQEPAQGAAKQANRSGATQPLVFCAPLRRRRRLSKDSSGTTGLHSQPVAMRICLVTPFSWSQHHPVNENVAGIAAALRKRGHHVTVLAPSNRAAVSRRPTALERGEDANFIAVGTAIPVTRRSTLGIPVAFGHLALGSREGTLDIVHGFEPGFRALLSSPCATRDR